MVSREKPKVESKDWRAVHGVHCRIDSNVDGSGEQVA